MGIGNWELGIGNRSFNIELYFPQSPITNHQSPVTNHQSPITLSLG
ncbi:hypothetical protein [Sphaerospermopsis sp. LEGE 00249]|nr:hypothetical protein [Sphaerospermopsis sp. LEGE 00249]